MELLPKFKELLSVIKSGIYGALALNGICIILYFVGYSARVEWISYLNAKTLAQWPVESVFVVSSGIGFIIGLVMRRLFPRIQLGIALLCILSIPLIIGGWLVYESPHYVEGIPGDMKLADCTNGVLNIHLKVPQGLRYELILGIPEIHASMNGTVTSSYNFSGSIRILSDGSLIADLPTGSDKAWLVPGGFVLTGAGPQNTNVPPLEQFIQPQKEYDIRVTLNPPPPPSSSIRLYWTRSLSDANKEGHKEPAR